MRFPALAGFSAGLAVASVAAFALTNLDSRPAPARAAAAAATARSVSNPSADSAGRVYAGAEDSVAYISAQTDQGTATGSGFVVSSDGKIVTNEHVVDGAQQVTVKLGTDGEEQPATVLAADASKDLALLQLDTGGPTLPPLPVADP